MKKQLICAGCGSIEKTKKEVRGNLAVEIILWLCFIIPGLIYSIWRQGTYHNACAVCGSTNLIPIDSPVGQKLLKEQGKTLEQLQTEQPKPKAGAFASKFSNLMRKIFDEEENEVVK